MAEIDDILRQLAEEVRKAGGTNRSEMEAVKLKIKTLALDKDNHAQLKKFLEAKNLPNLAKQINLTEEQIKELRPTVRESISAFDELGEKIRDASDATIGIARAFYKGEGTVSSFTENLSGKFGVVGDAIAGTGKLLDTNIEMFRQLSQVGANFGRSIVQLRQAAAQSALPLDDFAKLVGENSRALAALAGSTTRGAEFIAGLGNALRLEAVPQLATLGFTVDEINETLLLNLERQRRTGVLDREATQFNIDSAISFGRQLDRLSKLTGLQREELARQIESAQSNERFQAFLQGSTDDTRQRLDLFAGTVSSLSPQLAEGFQDLIANSGVAVTDSARELIQNAPQLGPVVRDLISGQVTAEQALARVRDISTQSVERFRTATVTGVVGFTRLQGGFIELSRRLVDVNAVLGEQSQLGDELTTGLTQFEDATKRIGSATQSLETAFLAFTGNLLGDATSAVNTGLTGLSKAILGLPGFIAAGLYGTGKLLQGGLALLKDTGPTYAAVYAGVRAGMAGGGMLGGLAGGAKSMARTVGGTALRVGGVGVGAMGVSQFGQMAKESETKEGKFGAAAGSAASGALIGATIGSIIPVLGTTAGALIGGALGGGYGLYKGFGGPKQFGGSMDSGKMYLTGESGPELITTGTKSAVTANQDLKSTFDTSELENKMISMVRELNAANKTLNSMVNGVNTLVAVESRALKAVETTARKDRNQVGLV